jgi:hypothetical protein
VLTKTWNHKKIVLIRSKGYILGRVYPVRSDIGVGGVGVILKTNSSKSGQWVGYWIFQASAKPIQIGDIICILQGASKPTIVRLLNDHCIVILRTATAQETKREESRCIDWSKSYQLANLPARDFQLIWNWDNLTEQPQDLEEELATDYHSDKASRSWNLAMILEDAGAWKEAEERLRRAMKNYEIVQQKEHMFDAN